MANRLRVIHKPAGYQAYKDTVPIRGANVRAIMIMAGVLFGAGVLVTLGIFALVSSNPVDSPTPENIVGADLIPPEITPTINEPTATVEFTQIPTHTPTYTPTPFPVMEMTLQALQARMDNLRSTPAQIQQVVVTATPQQVPTLVAATSTPGWDRWAVVVVDCAVVRAAPGRNYRALASACRGARYPVIDTHNEWVQIYYEGFDSAWIAAHLLRIEYD